MNEIARSIAIQFNNCINNRNLRGLLDLMTEDHLFIDSGNNEIKGKSKCEAAWANFFEAFPDYKNVFETFSSKDNMVIIQGHSVCLNKSLEGRGIWTAKIVDNKVMEWRIYLDTEENKKLLGLD